SKELDRLEDVKADKKDLEATNAKVGNNTTNITQNTTDIADHSKELDRLEDVKADKKDIDAMVQTEFGKASEGFNEKISGYVTDTSERIEKMNKEQKAVDTTQDNRISINEQLIGDLGYKMDNMESKLSAGI